jgi:hypothetical protein
VLQGASVTLFDSDFTETPAWAKFADSWNDLHQDQFMADGGSYRLRRFSEFHLDMQTRNIATLPHVAYHQSKQDNYLNGGISRMYSAIKSEIQTNPTFIAALLRCADVFAPSHPNAQWLVQVFQNRILANQHQLGLPTPEGVHRDGVDYVLTLLIKRHNIEGGESATYLADGVSVISKVTLQTPGDYILLDDRVTKHSVEAIARHDSNQIGYRDALIVMFTQLSNNPIER